MRTALRQYFVACAGIVNDKGQIFLTQRYNPKSKETHGKWQFPGGSVEQAEHPKDAAVREVFEETKLRIKILSEHPLVYSHTFNNGAHIVLFIYKARYLSGEIDISDDRQETSDAKWFYPSEVERLDYLPLTDIIVRDILTLS